MTPGPGIEPGTHWWEASALTTAPCLLPQFEENMRLRSETGWAEFGTLGTRLSQMLEKEYTY